MEEKYFTISVSYKKYNSMTRTEIQVRKRIRKSKQKSCIVLAVLMAILLFILVARAVSPQQIDEVGNSTVDGKNGRDVVVIIQNNGHESDNLTNSEYVTNSEGIATDNLLDSQETKGNTIIRENMNYDGDKVSEDAEVIQTKDGKFTIVIESKVEENTVNVMPQLSADEPGSEYYYIITDAEKMLIAKVVYAESRGEPFEGQVAVASTVFNRFYCTDPAIHNDSIKSVVTQSGAYASIASVTDEQAMTCIEAVEQAAKGWDPTRKVFENGARFFYAPAGTGPVEMAKREGILKQQIGNHVFHDDFAC